MSALAWKIKPPPAPYTAPTFNGRADGANGVVMAGAGVVAGAVGAGAIGAACGACGGVASFMGAFLSGLVIGGDPSNHTSLPGVRCERRGSSGGN
jgi:hypothetical protein